MRTTGLRLGLVALALVLAGALLWSVLSGRADDGLVPGSSAPAVDGQHPSSAPVTASPGRNGTRQSVPTGSLLCTVLEAGSETPLEGFVVRALRGDTVLSELRSDAAGRARIERAAAAQRIRVEPRAGWSVLEPAQIEIGDGTHYVFHAERVPETWIRGRLIDAATEEPLPEYRFELLDHEANVRDLETDARGEFRFASDPAPTRIRFIDHPGIHASWIEERSAQEFAPPVADHEWLHRVRVGPTYRLDLSGQPEDTGALRALLLNPDELHVLEETFDSWISTPVRDGERPWIRFPPRLSTNDQGPWRVFVITRDGYGQGRSAPLDSIRGVYPGVVSVAMQGAGRVAGRLLGPDGSGIPRGAVYLTPSPEATAEGAEFLSTSSDDEGAFCLEWRPPGAYTLEVRAERYERLVSPVRVTAEETLQQDLRLTPLRSAGSIRGRVVCRKGVYEGPATARLRHGTHHFQRELTFERVDGQRVAPFEFAELPDAEYELTVSAGWLMDVTPARRKVRPPAQDVELVLEDGGPLVDYGFRIFDAQTGEPIPEAHLHLWDGSQRRITSSTWGEVAIESVPGDKSLPWMLAAGGYAPAYGDEHSFGAGETTRFAERHLEPGWGAQFEIRVRGEPLSGVAVLLDGEPAGVSDAAGVLRVQAAQPPARVEVRYRDWTHWPDDIDADGRIASEWAVLRIDMRPPD